MGRGRNVSHGPDYVVAEASTLCTDRFLLQISGGAAVVWSVSELRLSGFWLSLTPDAAVRKQVSDAGDGSPTNENRTGSS